MTTKANVLKAQQELSRAIDALHTAIDAESATRGKWLEASHVVRQWFGKGLEQWRADKAGIISKLIVPALPTEQQAALLRDLPRKGTKAHKEWLASALTPSGLKQWIENQPDKAAWIELIIDKGEAAVLALLAERLFNGYMQEKIVARAYANTMFGRVTEYAFQQEIEAEKAAKKATPSEASEGDNEGDEVKVDKTATNKARLTADLSNWVKRLQKSEGEDFDINATISSLQATLAILTK